MPIHRLRRYAELARSGEGNEAERLALLEEHRDAVKAQLTEVRKHLGFIERKPRHSEFEIGPIEL